MSGSRSKHTGVGGGAKRARLPPPVQAVRFSGVWACWSKQSDPGGFVALTPKWGACPPGLEVPAAPCRSPLRSAGRRTPLRSKA
eukprot:2249359-Amphidinium_carterae.1